MRVDVLLRGSVSERTLQLNVLGSTQVQQLRELILIQLRSGTVAAAARDVGMPATAPARAAGYLAASLEAAATDTTEQPPLARATTQIQDFVVRSYVLRLIFDHRLLRDVDDERTLENLGVEDAAILTCAVTVTIETATPREQAQLQENEALKLACFPRSCSTDGGRVVHVAGAAFPAESRLVCRFGTMCVNAEAEDDGSESGVSQMKCVAPPHPAGPVTLSVSFDGGLHWIEGPSFWYHDPTSARCPFGITVPASCQGVIGVRTNAFGAWQIRRDGNNDRDPGGGCA